MKAPRGRTGRPTGGKTGPFAEYGRVLRERREILKLTQTALAKRIGISQSFLGRLERGLENLPNYDLAWFVRLAPSYDWTLEEMLEALGIGVLKISPQHTSLNQLISDQLDTKRSRNSTSMADLRRRGDEELAALRREPTGLVEIEYYTAGAGASLGSDEEEPEGRAIVPNTRFLEKYPNGKYVQVSGNCMEPLYPEGWFVAVIPEPGLADYRSPVLVWFSDNGRKVKYLIQAREEGDHILLQLNPPPNERRIVRAPIGSRILGVVVEVLPPIHPGHAPKLRRGEIEAIIAEEEPELLEEL